MASCSWERLAHNRCRLSFRGILQCLFFRQLLHTLGYLNPPLNGEKVKREGDLYGQLKLFFFFVCRSSRSMSEPLSSAWGAFCGVEPKGQVRTRLSLAPTHAPTRTHSVYDEPHPVHFYSVVLQIWFWFCLDSSLHLAVSARKAAVDV